MNIPSKIRYTKGHEWIRIEKIDAYIEITDFAQHELRDIVYVEIGTVVKRFIKMKYLALLKL